MRNLDILEKLSDFFIKHQDKEVFDETIESYWYTVFHLYLQLFQVQMNMSPYFAGVGWVEDQVCFGTSDAYPESTALPSYEINFKEVDQNFVCENTSFSLNDLSFSNLFLINFGVLPDTVNPFIFIMGKGSIIRALGSAEQAYAVLLYVSSGGQQYLAIFGVGSGIWYIPVNLSSNTWYSMAICTDGVSRYFYLNSILIAKESFTPTGIDVTGRLIIGYGYPLWGDTKIDEARFYNTCLTQERIIAYHNSGAGSYGSVESDLQAGYHFDESSGSTTADYSGNENTLVWKNTPLFGLLYTQYYREASMYPYADFESNTEYNFIAKAGIKDIYGNSLSSDSTTTFTTKNTSIFKVDEIYPANNAIGVDTRDKIFITFNNKITSLSIKIYRGEEELPVGTAVFFGDGNLVKYTPVDELEPETLYEVVLSKETLDTYGNTLPEVYRWFFTTGVIYDTAAPEIVSTSPVNGEVDISICAPLIVTFNKAMDWSRIKVMFWESGGGDAIMTPINHKTAIFKKEAFYTFTPGNVVTAQFYGKSLPLPGSWVADTVVDSLGNFGSIPYLYFSVKASNTTELTFIDTFPSNNSTNVDIATGYKYGYFSNPLSDDEISDNTFQIVKSNVEAIPPVRLPGEKANPGVTYYLYDLDLDYISIPVLKNKIENATITLYENEDYIIENQKIKFYEEPPDVLYAYRARINKYDLFYLYGALLSLSKERDSTAYLAKVQALWTVMKTGPTIENIRRSTYVFFNLPFSYEVGIVKEVIPSSTGVVGTMIIQGVHEYTYVLPTGLIWQLEEGDSVEKYQALCSGVEIFDYKKDPQMIYKIPFVDLQKYIEGGTVEDAEIWLNYSLFGIAVEPGVYSIVGRDSLLEFIRRIQPAYVNAEILAYTESVNELILSDSTNKSIGKDLTPTVFNNPVNTYAMSDVCLNYETLLLQDALILTEVVSGP